MQVNSFGVPVRIETIIIQGGIWMTLSNPAVHQEWVIPHSLEWYKQLSKKQSTYTYSWDSIMPMTTGENIFEFEVRKMVENKAVLDIGCGDGRFAKECSKYAGSIVGVDATDQFIQTGTSHNLPNVKFIVGNTKEPFPFLQNTFDCAYNRKGPTSAYPLLSAVMKTGGDVIGIHPGDTNGKELSEWFPNFFALEKGTPIKDKLTQQLSKSGFSSSLIEEFQSVEYLITPMDIVKYRCFGQTKTVVDEAVYRNLEEITKMFSLYRKEQGLPITHSHYIVRAVI